MEALLLYILSQYHFGSFELYNSRNVGRFPLLSFDNIVENSYDVLKSQKGRYDNKQLFTGYYFNVDNIRNVNGIHEFYENIIELSTMLQDYNQVYIIPTNFAEKDDIIYPDYSRIAIYTKRHEIPFYKDNLIAQTCNNFKNNLNQEEYIQDILSFPKVATPINFNSSPYFYASMKDKSDNILIEVNLSDVIDNSVFGKIRILNPKLIQLHNQMKFLEHYNDYDSMIIVKPYVVPEDVDNVINFDEMKTKLENLCKTLSENDNVLYLLDKQNNSYNHYDDMQIQKNISMNIGVLNYYNFEEINKKKKEIYLIFKNKYYKIFIGKKYKCEKCYLIQDNIQKYLETGIINTNIFD